MAYLYKCFWFFIHQQFGYVKWIPILMLLLDTVCGDMLGFYIIFFLNLSINNKENKNKSAFFHTNTK